MTAAPAASRTKHLRQTVVILAVGLIYLLIVEKLGRGIPCLFFEITGLRCPGCGVTRMFRALAHLDVRRAFHCNAAAMICLPFLVIQYAAGFRSQPPSESFNRFFQRLNIGLAVMLLIFGVVRNLPAFSPWLNP